VVGREVYKDESPLKYRVLINSTTWRVVLMYCLEVIKRMNNERVQRYNISNATLRIAREISKDVKQNSELKNMVGGQ